MNDCTPSRVVTASTSRSAPPLRLKVEVGKPAACGPAVSTVTPLQGSRTVSLSGTTPAPADQVLAFYRAALVGQGFVETAGPQAAGFPTATFSRSSGADLLVLAVTTLEGVQSFTLGGALAG